MCDRIQRKTPDWSGRGVDPACMSWVKLCPMSKLKRFCPGRAFNKERICGLVHLFGCCKFCCSPRSCQCELVAASPVFVRILASISLCSACGTPDSVRSSCPGCSWWKIHKKWVLECSHSFLKGSSCSSDLVWIQEWIVELTKQKRILGLGIYFYFWDFSSKKWKVE